MGEGASARVRVRGDNEGKARHSCSQVGGDEAGNGMALLHCRCWMGERAQGPEWACCHYKVDEEGWMDG